MYVTVPIKWTAVPIHRRTRFSLQSVQPWEIYICFSKTLKNTEPGKHQEPLEFLLYPHNEKLCVVNCILEYKRRTELIRENLEGTPTEVVLSYAYPHKHVKSATIARYVKLFLGLAGIDITVFTAHSTRSASTSKANNLGLCLQDIKKAGGWRSNSTFRKFYKLPIHKNFGSTLLNGCDDQIMYI